MKYKKIWLAIANITVILALLFIFAWGNGMVGVSKNKIEADARKSQKIDENWLVVKDVNDKMGILLFHDEEINNHVFSIYLNRNDFSWGYMFREGGSLLSKKEEIQGISYQDKGMALFSMNGRGVKEIKINNGVERRTVQINPSKPFAVIISSDDEEVSLYNSNGESIAIDNIQVY